MSEKTIITGLERGKPRRSTTSEPFSTKFVVYQEGQLLGAYPSIDLSIESAVRLKGTIIIRFPVDFEEYS